MLSALELTLLLLAASVLAVGALRSLQLPPVFGYLLVGVVVGPHGLALAPDSAETYRLAEFGVVFLMFSIGLEFSLPRLRSLRAIVLGVGLSQVVITLAGPLALGLLVGQRIGIGSAGAFALGAALAMSSTAIVRDCWPSASNWIPTTGDYRRRAAVPGPGGGAVAGHPAGAGEPSRRPRRSNWHGRQPRSSCCWRCCWLAAAAAAALVHAGRAQAARRSCSCSTCCWSRWAWPG